MWRIALALLVALTGCSKKADSNKSDKVGQSKLGSQEVAKLEGAQVVVTISVDWEGAFLSPEGLQAMQDFRSEWKELPLTHFICPAYFARDDDAKALAEQVRAHVLDGDEVGLHLHSWFSLAKAAGITPKEAPNFYGDDQPPAVFDNGDRGYEVSLSAYSPEELGKLVTASLALLEANGLGRPNSFRAGGYDGSSEVLAAVRAANITVDSSATWPTWFDAKREGRKRNEDESRVLQYTQLKKSWPNMEELTQPYGFDTPAGALIEVPNTGSFAEYLSVDEMRGHLQRAMIASQKQGTPIFVDFGFHQESADEFITALSDALFNFKSSYPGVLRFSTVSAAAKEATGTVP